MLVGMRWEDLARSQGGVIDLAQLRHHGLTDDQIDGLVGRRDLVVVHPGVLRPAGAADTTWGRLNAAALWCGGVVTHRSAASVWDVPVPASAHDVEVAVPDLRFRGRRPGVRIYRVQLPERDVTVVRGLRITTRVRTIVDLLGALPLPAGRELAGRALRKNWIALSDLDRRLVDGRGRTGNVRIRTLRREADPQAHAEFERRVHALLRAHDIGGWQPQYPVRMPSGQVIHADLAFPERRLIVELDGWAWHDDVRFRRDRKRWRGAVAAGWRVVQFTWDDLDHPERFIAEIVQLLAS